jgi:hypothetical protein
MRWELIDHYHLKSGPWTISKAGNLEMVKLPYGLWFQSSLIRHFATSQEAKAEAEAMTVTQI